MKFLNSGTISRTLADASETVACGETLGRAAAPGGVIALIGNLGAGKTTLTQGIMAGLGYREEVTSPTFSLVQEYHGGRLDVFHFDFYRMENEHELIELGWDDFLERGGLVIVEWPALFPQLLPPNTQWLELAHGNSGHGRTIRTIQAPQA
ncbi:MAG: tRNA (adenosine(37)-N6)-threonylcarbamoyltransferase complex ATPase subunit type 1 TsaE [Akkermansiaceae bacterium]